MPALAIWCPQQAHRVCWTRNRRLWAVVLCGHQCRPQERQVRWSHALVRWGLVSRGLCPRPVHRMVPVHRICVWVNVVPIRYTPPIRHPQASQPLSVKRRRGFRFRRLTLRLRMVAHPDRNRRRSVTCSALSSGLRSVIRTKVRRTQRLLAKTKTHHLRTPWILLKSRPRRCHFRRRTQGRFFLKRNR